MPSSKRWILAPADAEASAKLASRLKVSPLVAQILLNRGLEEQVACERFLSPALKHLHDPADLGGLAAAAERIAKAIRDREKIVVYGDYDVDGITASAILWHAVRVLGGDIDYYIPNRLEEGYGLNAEALAQLCDEGAKLIVTVDCGVTAIEQAKVAKSRGVDLIITDHHDWRVEEERACLPDCRGVVHPRLNDDGKTYGNPSLCGAGVAFKLAWGVGTAMSGATRVSETFRAFLLNATALAALGTIADVVPLTGENRALAHFGLKGLVESKLTGLQALIDSAGLAGKALDAYDVGFKLAPRLNAVGRLGHAKLAVEMLTTATESRAHEIAEYLEGQNRERQAVERKIVDQAIAQVAERGLDADDSRAIVLGDETWHAGVIGIVASRLVDKFHRPAVLVSLVNGHGQGSGRSISGFNLAKALQACGEHLQSFGGHEMAAGLKIESARFEAFREAFNDYARRTISAESLAPRLRIDAVAELPEITAALVNDLARLGPFGHGNPRPLLCCRNLKVAQPPRRVGKTGDHLQIVVRQGQAQMKCIAFGYGAMEPSLQPGTIIDLAVEPQLNEFNGQTRVELGVKDLQFPKLG